MTDFSQVPEDILAKIVNQHLATTLADHIAFAGVCKSWRSAALLPHNRCRRGTPGILMSPKLQASLGRRDVTTTTTIPRCGPPHRFFPDLHRTPSFDPRGKLAAANSAASFASIGTSHCVGSNDGWLVLVRSHRRRRGGIRVCLLNPVTEETVDLPSLRLDAGFRNVHKAVLSSSPDDKGCYLFLFFYLSPQLAWCNVAGDGGGWKFAGDMDSRVFQGVPDAASYSDGRLFVVVGDCVYVLNITQDEGSVVRALIQFSPAMRSSCLETRTVPYTCHIDGQLHVILLRRVRVGSSDGTTFEVYKLLQNDAVVDSYKHDHGARTRRNYNYYSWAWERVRSLKGHAVFVGTHQCFSLPVVPNDAVERNCIYFALNGCQLDNIDNAGDNSCWIWCRYDCGVFNVGEGRNQGVAYTHGDYNCVWFLPMPWNISKHREQNAKGVRDGRLLEGKEENSTVCRRRPRRRNR